MTDPGYNRSVPHPLIYTAPHRLGPRINDDLFRRLCRSRDYKKTYEELKAKGVVFSQPPTERFYGIEALMKDDSGNWFSMSETKEQ